MLQWEANQTRCDSVIGLSCCSIYRIWAKTNRHKACIVLSYHQSFGALCGRTGHTPSLAKDIHVQKLRLASDCANVIRNIKGGSMGTYSQIVRVREIRSGEQFAHENRRTNGAAHRLAKSSLYNSTGRHVWFLSPPDDVYNSIPE
jgi:hypothetical protein